MFMFFDSGFDVVAGFISGFDVLVFSFFYLIKINKFIFFNLNVDMAFFNAKIDFLIIILMCRQPRQNFFVS